MLFVILVSGTEYYVQPDSMHMTMEECFQRRELIVQMVGEPIVNYQAVCIAVEQGSL